MAIETFDTAEDEGRYLAWVAAHPDGFVVNTTRPKPNPNELVLHLGRCHTISELQVDKERFTGGSYQKVCSLRWGELQVWAERVGGKLQPCSFCEP
ncbi:MAG: hypothetical protein ABIQ47_00540 [Tepidiformaceae bacterium]